MWILIVLVPDHHLSFNLRLLFIAGNYFSDSFLAKIESVKSGRVRYKMNYVSRQPFCNSEKKPFNH